MTASLKIRALEAKISELKTRQQELLKRRHLDIAEDISRLNLAHFDHVKLMGALLFISDKITTNDPIAEDWFITGEKFLRRKKSKSCSETRKTSQTIPTNKPSYK